MSEAVDDVTWKDLAEIVERIGRIEERVAGLNDELKAMASRLEKLDSSIGNMMVQISNMQLGIDSGIKFYRKLAYRIIVLVIGTVVSLLIMFITRIFA
jgi:uncharacterized protein (UPF0335 family)